MTESNKPVYRVGIIGGGRQGTGHGRGYMLHPRTKVAAVADTDQENLDLFCKRFDVPGYSSYEEMLAREKLDIAAPILPVQANPDAVVAAAQAGVRAIFCEKPLAANLAQADRMVEECRTRGIPLAAGLVVSSHPDYRKAYQLAAAGEIGEVLRINLYDDNKQMGTHGLNLARKFADKAKVEFVTGHVSNDPFGDYEEDYEEGNAWYGYLGGYIRFANGIECFSSYTGPEWTGIEVIGTRGAIRNSNNTGLGLCLCKTKEGANPREQPDLIEVEGVFKPRVTAERGYDAEGWREVGEVMMESISSLVDALDNGTELEITTGDDLRQALEIAIGLRESARRNQARVDLPLADRSLAMHPEKWRWYYKKDVYGVEWYREQMKIFKRDDA